MTIPALKKLSIPSFEVEVPSTGKKILCRSFLVHEQKILLMAKELGGEDTDLLSATKELLSCCILDLKGHNIDSFALFDIEYIFLHLRMKSKGEIVPLRFAGINESDCIECRRPKEIELNLNNIKVSKDPDHSNKIELSNNVGLVLNYPQFSNMNKLFDSNDIEGFDVYYALAKQCLKTIYDEENIYEAKDFSESEIEEFLDSLTDDQFNKIKNFFDTMPKLECTVDLSCKTCGRKDIQTIRGLRSFFL